MALSLIGCRRPDNKASSSSEGRDRTIGVGEAEMLARGVPAGAETAINAVEAMFCCLDNVGKQLVILSIVIGDGRREEGLSVEPPAAASRSRRRPHIPAAAPIPSSVTPPSRMLFLNRISRHKCWCPVLGIDNSSIFSVENDSQEMAP